MSTVHFVAEYVHFGVFMYLQEKYHKILFLLVTLSECGIETMFELLSLLRNLSNLHASERFKFLVFIYALF